MFSNENAGITTIHCKSRDSSHARISKGERITKKKTHQQNKNRVKT